MDRIKALNRSDSEMLHAVDETSEKIIEELNQFYCRALQTKQNGQYESAIQIFQQILQHEDIERVIHKSPDPEKFILKYCCYKNLSEIYASEVSSYQIAISWFLKAYAMDNTDIYFMHKFGRIALQEQNIHLASMVFQRCLELNSDHIPSFDGILELLCNQEDYFEAYGWAIYCHKKFPKYQRAIDVILDVQTLLKSSSLLQNAFTPSSTDVIGKRSSMPSLFPSPSYFDIYNDAEPMNFTEFTVTKPTFLAFGRMIKSIFVKSTLVTSYLTTKLSFNDICHCTNHIDTNCNTEIDEKLSKPTLQQFSERIVCNDHITNRSPIQTIFQEIIPRYFSMDCDEDVDIQPPSLIRAISQPNYLDNVISSTTNDETFHINSITYLRQFIDTLKAEQFHMLDIVFEWLKWLSKCSHIQLPIELQCLYIEIFEYQSNHIDWNMWHGLPHTKTFDLFVMAVFYIELKIVSNVRNSAGAVARFFDDHLIQKFHHILFIRNLFIDNCDPIVEARLNLLHFQFAIEMNDMELGSDLLNKINACFSNETNPIEMIRLPNQMYCTFMDPWIIANEMKLMECLMQQTSVQQYYSNGCDRFDDVVSILLMYRDCNFQSKQLSIFQQFEMLMETLWLTDRWDVCLHWCEIGLYESMRIWLQYKVKNQPISNQMASHAQFLMVYLYELVQLSQSQSVIASLNGKTQRLVRSMAILLEAQYDQTLVAQRFTLFDSNAFIVTLSAILNCDQHLAIENQWAALNIITKVAKWLILHNVPLPDDDQFLICAWRMLHSHSCNSTGPKFHSTEIIRLLSHSIFGYPNEIEQHQNLCICKRTPIDWNGDVALLFTSFDTISNGMSYVEQKSLIDDLLNSIPDDVQNTLSDAMTQLTNFLNDKIDFPHKCIPVKSIASNLRDIFHRIFILGLDVVNYSRYSREELIAIDLAINPQRFSSWMALLTTKMSQFDAIFNANDLTKINFDDVENLKNAIDCCFHKCQMLNRAEINISNVDHLRCYGLYAYGLCNFFVHGTTTMRAEFNGIYTPKRRISFNWNTAKRMLTTYLDTHHEITSAIEPLHKFQCYFVLGKISEKQHPHAVKDAIEFYLLAEQQLFNQEHDDALLSMKIEINFRITASIYKYILRVENVIDEHDISLLLQILKRDKSRIFSSNQLASRPNNTAAVVDENDNKVSVQQVTAIIDVCTDDFKWYLELCPAYYKAAYYLIKINLTKDESICRSLLLQLPRKINTEEKKLSLFNIHRGRQLFKVQSPMQLDKIHDMTSFSKYMEKCVHILIDYLARNRKPNLQLVLTLQWAKLKNSSLIHVRQHQKHRLNELILEQFVRAAAIYVNQFNSTSAKSKAFAEFFLNLYELYITCEADIKSTHFSAYSQMMITCFRLCNDDPSPNELDNFQIVIDHCAKKLNEKAQNQTDKAAKKLKPVATETSDKK